MGMLIRMAVAILPRRMNLALPGLGQEFGAAMAREAIVVTPTKVITAKFKARTKMFAKGGGGSYQEKDDV